MVKQLGNKWANIARMINTSAGVGARGDDIDVNMIRTRKQVEARWNALNPDIIKYGEWTDEDGK